MTYIVVRLEPTSIPGLVDVYAVATGQRLLSDATVGQVRSMIGAGRWRVPRPPAGWPG